MKYLFFGSGSIGRRHMKNLRSIYGNSIEIMAFKSGVYPDEPDDFLMELNVKLFYQEEDAFKQSPDIVFVTNPTFLHVKTIKKALLNNCHVFVEKPISINMEELDEIEKKANEKGLIVFIGYCLRYNAVINKCKQLLVENILGELYDIVISFNHSLINLHPWRNIKDIYRYKKEAGGDVALEFSHEIDYFLWMFGRPKLLTGFIQHTGKFENNTEDYFNVIMQLKTGTYAQISLNYLSNYPERKCQIVGENGVIKFDLMGNSLSIFHRKNNKPIDFKFDNTITETMYLDEIKNFMFCVNNNKQSPINIKDSKCILKLIDLARKSNDLKKTISWN